MSKLILYRAYGSPPSRAVMMLSELIGVPLEIKDVNVLKGEQLSKEYRKINPVGTVPTLIDGDLVLPESHAIMKYLMNAYAGESHAALYPRDVRTRALADHRLFFDAGVFFPAMLDVAAQTLQGKITEPTPPQIKRIDRSYAALEVFLEKTYLVGDQMTIADISNGSTATAVQAIHKVDAAKYPRCAEWLARLEAEPVFKTINAPGAVFFGKMLSKAWEQNKLKLKQ